MAGRVSQLPVEASGSGQTPKARVSQLPVVVSGSSQTPAGRVSQLVVQVSALTGIAQTSRFNNVNTFPAGGTVATTPGIPVIQAATWNNTNTFPAGGNLDVLTPLPLVQAATFVNTNTFFGPGGGGVGTGGSVALVVPPPPITPGTGGGTGTGPGSGPGAPGAPASPVAALVAIFTGQKKAPPPKGLNEYDARLDAHNALLESVLYPERTLAHPAPGVQSLKGLGDYGVERTRERGIPLIQSARVPGPDSIYVSSKSFFERGSIVTPVPGNTLVLEFKVPTGYWGRILGLYLHYTGTGFVPGSGDIIWRIQIGSRWMKGFGDMRFPMGSFENTGPLSEWQGLRSQRVVRVWVDVPNLSGLIQVGLSRILVGVQGWYYSVEERIQ